MMKRSLRCVLSHLSKDSGYHGTIQQRQSSTAKQAPLLQNKIHVSIEGNIGSGKTTFLKQFQGYGSFVEVVDEPVKQWRNFGGDNPLACMYEDPSRWAFTFQNLVFVTLLQQHGMAKTKPLRVMERSLLSARYCFAENLKHRGYLTEIESTILSQWFDFIVAQYKINVDLIVYLQTSPETCLERIKQRDRPEEQIVTLEYLRDLHNLHEDWLIHHKDASFIRPPVVVINGNQDLSMMRSSFSQLKSQILTRLENTTSQENPASQSLPG